jgi:hypothetical protein
MVCRKFGLFGWTPRWKLPLSHYEIGEQLLFFTQKITYPHDGIDLFSSES